MSTELAEPGSLALFERLAKDPGFPVDRLRELVELRKDMVAFEARCEFDAAFAEMQAELPVIIEKGTIHDKYGNAQSTFARFEDINEAIKPILKQHGFAISFRTAIEADNYVITGILSHRAGHRESTSLLLPKDLTGSKNTVQAIGSSVAYGKRYVMAALLNITTRGEDDDGQATGQAAGITIEQQKEIERLCAAISPTFLNRVLASEQVASTAEIKSSNYASIVMRLNKAKQEQSKQKDPA